MSLLNTWYLLASREISTDLAQAMVGDIGFLEEPVFLASSCSIAGFLQGEVAWLGLLAELVMLEVAKQLGCICPLQNPHH